MSCKASLTKKYAPSEDVVARKIQGEFLLIPISSEVVAEDSGIFSLNGTGRAVWSKLNGKRSLKEIAGILAGEYKEARAVVEKDILGLAQELLRRKILVEVK